MNVCKFKVLEIFLNIFGLISFKFGSDRGPPLGVLVFAKIDSVESFLPITSKRHYESS